MAGTPSWVWHENPTAENEVFPFVFVTVDVIDSSALFYEDMPDAELLEKVAAMNAVYEHVIACLGLTPGSPWEWNWAGDGGVFAFHEAKPLTAANALRCAITMADLKPFKVANGQPLRLQLRIVIDRGSAYFHNDKGLRRSAALNAASKLRVPGKWTSLTITESMLRKLHGDDKKPDLFKAISIPHAPQERVYGFVLLMRDALKAEIQAETMNDKAQAAHLSYRLGALNLGTGDQIGAADAFRNATSLIKAVEDKHRYYWRTLQEFYDLWRIIADHADDDLLRQADGHDWLAMMRGGSLWDAFARKHGPPERWRLLVHVELIMEQLDILAGQPVNDPVGLTSLEVCLLLERVGYARRWYGAALSERIQRIKKEMAIDRDHTIDEGCSMCTAVAASCLILDRQPEGKTLIEWLRLHDNERFCYRRHDSFADAEPKEHAVHYAAAVLQAFLDHDVAENDACVDQLLAVFFDNEEDFKAGTFPADWRRWRNTTVYDFCSYVFPVFAHYILMSREGGATNGPAPLTDQQKEILRRALQSLASHVLADGSDALLTGEKRGRVYGARENIGSFALGSLIGLPPNAAEIVHYNLRRFAAYAKSERSEAHRQKTIDSSIDRSRKMLAGWLLQIECALWLHRRNEPIPPPVVECLGIGGGQGEKTS
jgi:hypothetical protein